MAKPKETPCPHCGQPRARHPVVARTRFGVIRCDGEDDRTPDSWVDANALEHSIQIIAPNIGDNVETGRAEIRKVRAYVPALSVWLVEMLDDNGHVARGGKPIVWAIKAEYKGPWLWRRVLDVEGFGR